jgi:hypothetical protein
MTLSLTKTGAAFLATRAAWTCDHPDSSDCGRTLLHSRAGGIGADWDLESVLTFIDQSTEVGFGTSRLGHEMWVESGGRTVHFDVKAPSDPEDTAMLVANGYLVKVEES